MKKINKNKKNFSKKFVSFKKVLTYPNSGKIRYQVSLDKNGQVYEIRERIVSFVKNEDTNKQTMNITLGERPRLLFERIKGRPFAIATSWIDDFVQELILKNQ